MIALQDLQVLVRAGRAASLSEAARATGISSAAGSALVKRLEAELGITLFVRSTRSLCAPVHRRWPFWPSVRRAWRGLNWRAKDCWPGAR